MTEAEEVQVEAAVAVPQSGGTPVATSTAEQPISFWPEGALAIAAGVTLLVIGLRHRIYLQRKYTEIRRAVDEFQRQGGFDDLQQVARQAQDLIRGNG
jgi:hypothetical protein